MWSYLKSLANQMQQLFLTLGNHVVSVEIFHEAGKNPVKWRQDFLTIFTSCYTLQSR